MKLSADYTVVTPEALVLALRLIENKDGLIELEQPAHECPEACMLINAGFAVINSTMSLKLKHLDSNISSQGNLQRIWRANRLCRPWALAKLEDKNGDACLGCQHAGVCSRQGFLPGREVERLSLDLYFQALPPELIVLQVGSNTYLVV